MNHEFMSSFSCDFVNFTKRVWRPEMKTSSTIIDVVTHSRVKSQPKTAVDLKVADIRMPLFPFLDDFGYQDEEKDESLVPLLAAKPRSQVRDGSSKISENRMEISRKSRIRFVKDEKQLARKVYLRWSKYSTTEKHELGVSNGLCQLETGGKQLLETRCIYLAKKYWNLWRKAVENKMAGTWSDPERRYLIFI